VPVVKQLWARTPEELVHFFSREGLSHKASVDQHTIKYSLMLIKVLSYNSLEIYFEIRGKNVLWHHVLWCVNVQFCAFGK
jgi:hypothetical protein